MSHPWFCMVSKLVFLSQMIKETLIFTSKVLHLTTNMTLLNLLQDVDPNKEPSLFPKLLLDVGREGL